jgi:hypothetical protein
VIRDLAACESPNDRHARSISKVPSFNSMLGEAGEGAGEGAGEARCGSTLL